MNYDTISKTNMTSIAAVERYLLLDSDNRNEKHLAYILVHANGKDLSASEENVFIKLNESAVDIIIENFHTLYGERSNRFTLKDSSFYLINRTLQIKSTNAFGQPITVEITRKW